MSKKFDNMTPEELIKLHGSKSAAIRALSAEDYPTAEIARKVGVIYQHARNVLNRPLKRGSKTPPEVDTTRDG